ncbi:MAG TPA: hypothetical protein VMU59_15195 [Caulobacteraceae bacterium]|nr:hypothetical protein [Caulobacteraceae bacterium]
MSMPPCAGHPAVVRISKLSPTGTIAGLGKAVRDHQAWYAAHGQPNVKIVLAPMRGSSAGDGPTEFVTLTISDVVAPRPPSDDAYRAFVKEYDDNSTIEWTGLTCLTNDEAKAKAAMAGK